MPKLTPLNGKHELKTSNDPLAGLFGGDMPVPADAAVIPRSEVAPDEFAEVGDDIAIDHECPRCGYRFSGGKTVRREI
jgi:hypothetical protein